MVKTYFKIILISLAVLIILAVQFFVNFKKTEIRVADAPAGTEYKNNDYGFSVALPLSWEGYSVSVDTWTGNKINDNLGDKPFTSGPVISIHNPKWTKEAPYQDIPVMVFTTSQWQELLEDKFHIGAAPISPSELGRNSRYVFALPARYNYAYLHGFEEVEQILNSKPLKTF